MFDIIARWEHALEDIERAAPANGRTAMSVVAAARLNRRAIYQRYALHMQDLADRMADNLIQLANIEDTIHRVFGFEEGPLWDSPGNIRCINAVQDGYATQDQNRWGGALPHSQYGGTILPEM